MIRDEEVHAVGMRQEAVAKIIESSISDLLFLSELNELYPFLASHTSENREPLSKELGAFSRRQEIYDQIRILSPAGMEILRIDYREGTSVAVPPENLQFKGDRPYFQEMFRCVGGPAYVSPLDLNVEDGQVELPLQPMLRLGLALGYGLGRQDEAAGYLLLNMKGSVVLDTFAQAHPHPDAMALLVNQDGYWLRGPAPETEWGFILPERADERFQARFPLEWEAVSSARTGQFVTENGLFTYDTLIPYAEADAVRYAGAGGSSTSASTVDADALYWKNVSWVPSDLLARTRSAGTAQLAGWNVVGVLILGSGSWVFARWLTRRAELHRRTTREKLLVQSTLQKYLSKEVYDRLLGDPARHAQLGGESQDVTVLFADIRGFTRFAERHAPKDVVAVLNRTLTELVAPLRVYGGILDKYLGDGFLAFFEPSPDLPDAAQRAVDAARVMQLAFRNLWTDAPAEALRELGLGIGISTGRVIVGNVGSEDATDYTVVGDAVNVAARLQSLAEAGDILVSHSAYELLDNEDDAEAMQLTKLRGRREPVNVFRLRTK